MQNSPACYFQHFAYKMRILASLLLNPVAGYEKFIKKDLGFSSTVVPGYGAARSYAALTWLLVKGGCESLLQSKI